MKKKNSLQKLCIELWDVWRSWQFWLHLFKFIQSLTSHRKFLCDTVLIHATVWMVCFSNLPVDVSVHKFGMSVSTSPSVVTAHFHSSFPLNYFNVPALPCLAPTDADLCRFLLGQVRADEAPPPAVCLQLPSTRPATERTSDPGN